jgi:DNA sulfur modification protein DndD
VHLSRDGVQMSGDQIESEVDQIAPEQISRFFLFDGELLGEYESLLIEGSEQGRQIREAIEQVLGVPALINGRTELGAILKSATKRQSSELSHIQGLEKQAERQLELTASQFVLLVHSGEIRPETDLASIRPRIGAAYRITEVTATQSQIERTTV